MNRRFDTRRSGRESERYESERGNARSDRERYELRDRDESGYRGWGGEDRDDERSWSEWEDRDERASFGENDDRDRWRSREQMEQSDRFRRPGQFDREQMQYGRGGYGVTSSDRMGFGRNRDYGRGFDRDRGADRNRTGDFREREFGHRGYGGSMSGQWNQGQWNQGQGRDWNQRQGMNAGMNQGMNQGRDWDRSRDSMQGRDWNQERSWNQGRDWNRNQGGYGGPSHSDYGGQGFMGQQGFGTERRRSVKGYKRSDERIREDVCDQLGQADDIDPSEIEVTVSSGEVTLSGSVNERRMKYTAEQLAERISGVNEIHNQLRVKQNTGTQGQNFSTHTSRSDQSTQQQQNPNGARGASR